MKQPDMIIEPVVITHEVIQNHHGLTLNAFTSSFSWPELGITVPELHGHEGERENEEDGKEECSEETCG